ncbi:N-formylglutamate amidohydrolase [Rhizobium sp. PAMB 3182]
MLHHAGLLARSEGDPVGVVNPGGAGDILIVCEHASSRLPASVGDLGLTDEVLKSHVAWDPGALAVAERLSVAFDAPLVYQQFSRLVYDCNRPPESPGAMPEVSEIYDIPGNRNLSEQERNARVEALYLPFHSRVEDVIAAREAAARGTVLVTMHSFTPVYFGKQREVEIGILHDDDARLADRMLSACTDADSPYRVRRNEPYGPADGVTHTLNLHAKARGMLNVMIEVRNDLIADAAGQDKAAGFLEDLLKQALQARS